MIGWLLIGDPFACLMSSLLLMMLLSLFVNGSSVSFVSHCARCNWLCLVKLFVVVYFGPTNSIQCCMQKWQKIARLAHKLFINTSLLVAVADFLPDGLHIYSCLYCLFKVVTNLFRCSQMVNEQRRIIPALG